MRTILVVIYVTIFLILALPVMGIEWIVAKFNKKAADISQLRMVQWGFRCVMFLSGTKIVVRGAENVPKDEAVLYVGNHKGFFDIVTTYSLCPGLTGYISKDNVKKVPILGMVMTRLYCLFLDRKDLKQGLKIILTAIEYVKDGISICIFPEGTRNKESDPTGVLPFHDGSFKIAQKTGCKIVPMAISGSDKVLENHFPWIHKSVVTITYGQPFAVADLDKDQQKKIGAYCQKIVSDMLREQCDSK